MDKKGLYNGLFDTDSKALNTRIEINSNLKYNLEEWIIDQLTIDENFNILDIGCGTGKQVKAISQAFPYANILGVDLSDDALSEIEVSDKVKVQQCSFDDLSSIQGKYDLIISTYAIYYSKNIVKTISDCCEKLNKNGVIFLVGPGDGTNKEIIDLCNSVATDSLVYAKDFISQEELDEVRKIKNVGFIEEVRLNNYMDLSKDDLFLWWRNHNTYQSQLDHQVYQICPDQITLTKNVLGIKIYVNVY